MNIRHSEIYGRPTGARFLVGSTLAPMCKSRYTAHFVAVDVKNTRTIVDQSFSVPKILRVIEQNVLRNSREVQRRITIDIGKEVLEIRQWELQ